MNPLARRPALAWLSLLLIAAALCIETVVAAPMTFTVLNAGNSGAGSLRQAILDANANSGTDRIEFNISGAGPFTIQVFTPLPQITEAVTIDGFTQSGATPNTLPAGNDATYQIALDGSGLSDFPGIPGLRVTSGGSTIRGLVLQRFPSTAIRLEGAGANVIAGNFIGTDFAGTDPRPNGDDAVHVLNSPGNRIGGTTPADRNLISANQNAEVTIEGSSAANNLVQGNFIGPDRTGTVVIPRAPLALGVHLLDAPSNFVGGTTAGAGNLISGNLGEGIVIVGTGATGNLIQGNRIGTDVTGAGILANGFGVFVDDCSGNTIGGTTAGAGNVISGNGGYGVKINNGANAVRGNLIGPNAAGTLALGNGTEGVFLETASGCVVGGRTPAERNVISGNVVGVSVSGGSGHTIEGNYIGTDAAGTAGLGNTSLGVVLGNTSGNTVGGSASGAGNVISRSNIGVGIALGGSNTVQGNRIGTDASGMAALGNQTGGVFIQFSSGNQIGGAVSGAGNLISGNAAGVGVIGGGTNQIRGNIIGLNAAGTAALGNTGVGIALSSSPSNTIGGTTAADRNVITGNQGSGIIINAPSMPGPDGGSIPGNGDGSTIQGNYIGTNSAGTAGVGTSGNDNMPAGNLGGGILLAGVSNTIVKQNVVAGNYGGGLFVTNDRDASKPSTGTVLHGNLIGLNAAGTAGIENAGGGLWVDGAPDTKIGGAGSGEGNVISGHSIGNVFIFAEFTTGAPASRAIIQGNRIGTNAAGTAVIPPEDGGTQTHGISIQGSSDVQIGGTATAARNQIAGTQDGILVARRGTGRGSIPADRVLIKGNLIGTDASGAAALPQGTGVWLTDTQNSVVGGAESGAGNTIAFLDASPGVAVRGSSSGCSILSNKIHSNAVMGIDLGNDGPTANDSLDGDAGPNGLQNYPTLTDVSRVGGSIRIQGLLNSTPQGTFRLEFFANRALTPASHGEGEFLLGAASVTTDGGGNAAFEATFSGPSNAPYITATATDSAGSTSEFSPALQLAEPPPSAPIPLTATGVSASQINLVWGDTSDNETGFKIERKEGGIGSPNPFREIRVVGANVTTFGDTRLAPDTLYTYRVRAYNATGPSGYSPEAQAQTRQAPPAAPTGLTAVALSSTEVKLDWTFTGSGHLSFEIERRNGPIGSPTTFVLVGVVQPTDRTFTNTELFPGRKYVYRVLATNGAGKTPSTEVEVTTTPLPNTPTNLIATPVSQNQIDLTWTDNSSDETGFEIEWKAGTVSQGGAYTRIATNAPGDRTYSHTGLATGSTSTYRVRAVRGMDFSAYSNTATATTLPDPPGAPTGLTARPLSSTSVRLNWSPGLGVRDGFRIEQTGPADGKGDAPRLKTISVGPNATTYDDTGLTPNTTYSYVVRAFNAGGSSPPSNTATATTLPNPPSRPTNLTASPISGEQVGLIWTDGSNNEDGFKLERKTGPPSSPSAYREIRTLPANTNRFTDTELTPGSTYTYRMRAYNAGGNSPYSNEASTTTPAPPAAPLRLTAALRSRSEARLQWEDRSNNEQGFKIERRRIFPQGPGSYAQIDEVGAGQTSYVNAGLAPNTEYTYRVRAFNAGGNSPYSNEAAVITPLSPPRAPSNLTARPVSRTEITLRWVENSTDEDGFRVERAPVTDGVLGTFAQIVQLPADQLTYNNTGLTPETTYAYRVLAFNSGGSSDYSNTARATTLPNPPAAPSNLRARAVSQTRIDLTWDDNSTNEEGFIVERKAGGPQDPGSFGERATLGRERTGYSDTTVETSRTYTYRVKAYNVSGESLSNEATATALPDPPPAPANLRAEPLSGEQILVFWDDRGFEDGFKLERKSGPPAGMGVYSEIRVLGQNVTDFTDTGLTPGATYTYQVRAYNAGGNSPYSNVASAATPLPPAAPTSLSAMTVSSSEIRLDWQHPSNDEWGFKVERKQGAPADPGTYTQIADVAGTTYASTGLAANTRYSYRVRAYSDGGNSAYSNEASATTLPNAPRAPQGLTAVPASQVQIRIDWEDKSDNEDGFKIEMRQLTEPSTEFAELDTTPTDVSSYDHAALTANTEYAFRVRAFNAGGNSAYTNVASARTPPSPPAPPSSITTRVLSQTEIQLGWTDGSNDETGFEIERDQESGIAARAFQKVGTTPANVTTFTDRGLTANTLYVYRVRAVNRGGPSDYSQPVSVSTLPNPPAAPTQLVATALDADQIQLTWRVRSADEDGFKLERKGPSDSGFVEIRNLPRATSFFLDMGLAPGGRYTYRVRGYNSGGNGPYSNDASATTIAPPATPARLRAAALSQTEIRLQWSDRSTNEDGFRVERSGPPSAPGTYYQIAQLGPNEASYTSAGLSPNTGYSFRVRAFNAGGISAYSNEASATTLRMPPAAPTDLAAEALNGEQIRLDWRDGSTDEVGFRIERKGGSQMVFVEIRTLAANATSFVDTGLTAGTRYTYRVRAFNSGGNSAYSNEAGATPVVAPAAPSGLMAVAVSQTEIRLDWTDGSSNEDGFRIERKNGAPADAGDYRQIAQVGANITTFNSTSLAANTSYSFRVRAFNRGGSSPYSNVANPATPPNPPRPPSGLTARALSQTAVRLAWSDKSENEDGFRIERQQTSGIAARAFAPLAEVGAGVTSYTDDTVAANTTYSYRVKAFNAGGSSDYSGEASVTTPPNPPAPPDNLQVLVVSQTELHVSWRDNADNETGFVLERRTGEGAFAVIARPAADRAEHADTGLTANTAYTYRVKAVNTGGESGYSNEASGTTLPNPPAAPTDLRAEGLPGEQVRLTWRDASSDEEGFRIERKLASEAATAYVEIRTLGADLTTFTDTRLTAGVAYSYRVRTYNRGGNSGYSNEATSTPLLPPAAPTNLTAALSVPTGNPLVKLNWRDNSADETGFVVERRLEGVEEPVFEVLVLVGRNVTEFVDETARPKLTYSYRVRARSAGGNSAPSNTVRLLIPASASGVGKGAKPAPIQATRKRR